MANRIKYSEMVSRLSKSGDDIRRQMGGKDMEMLHMAVGICGEAGELLDAIKKIAIYRKTPDRENVIEELGDIEFYLEGMRQAFGITRSEVLNANVKKLSVRYNGFKYSDAAAHARADKAVGK